MVLGRIFFCEENMVEAKYLRENLECNYLDHEFVGGTVFELDAQVRSPSLSTDAPGEEDPGEALLAL